MGITASTSSEQLVVLCESLGPAYSAYTSAIVDSSLDGMTLIQLSGREEIEEVLRLSGVQNLLHSKILSTKVLKAKEEAQPAPQHSFPPSALPALPMASPRPAAAAQAIPALFLCPLSRTLMNNPVVIADGLSYERSHIEAYLQTHHASPQTNEILPTKMCFPNNVLRALIYKWVADRGGIEAPLPLQPSAQAFRASPPPPLNYPSDFHFPLSPTGSEFFPQQTRRGSDASSTLLRASSSSSPSAYDDDTSDFTSSSLLMNLGEWDPTPGSSHYQQSNSNGSNNSNGQRSAPRHGHAPSLASHSHSQHSISMRTDDGFSSVGSTPRAFSALSSLAATAPPVASRAASDCAGKALKDCFSKSGSADLRSLKKLLETWSGHSDVLNWRDPADNGSSPLHEASRFNHRMAVKLLLSSPGTNVNLQDYSGATPLRLASYYCHTNVVRLLCMNPGVDVNLACFDGSTAFSCCKFTPKFNEVRRILRRMGATEPERERPEPAPEHVRGDIMTAILNRDLPALQALAFTWGETHDVFNEGDPNDRGNTPLGVAASDSQGSAMVALLLLLSTIDVNKSNVGGETPLHLSCRQGNADTVRQLLQVDHLDINRQDALHLRTALMVAVQHGHLDIIKLLLGQPDIEPGAVDKKGQTALTGAPTQEVRDFLQRELDATQHQRQQETLSLAVPTPLASAAQQAASNWQLVGRMLCRAAKAGDLQACLGVEQDWTADGSIEPWCYQDEEHNGFTPLHFAVQADQVLIVKTMCRIECVDVNAADSDNATPVHVAVQEDHRECLKLLLAHEAIDLKKRDKNTDTPLSMCARLDRRTCAKLLLQHPSVRRFINASNPGGLTALNIACYNGYLEIVRLLLSQPDIDVNKPNKKNSTPLIEACRKGRTDIVRLMVKHPKVDIEFRCLYGGDALSSCTRFPEIRRILLDAFHERGLSPVPYLDM